MNFGKIFEKITISTTFSPPSDGAVAFFDSGMGGLNLLKECIRLGLRGEILYYGDNARAPYGKKDPLTISSYAREAFEIFSSLNVSKVVLACNTLTALCLEEMQSRFSLPVFGTYPPIDEVKERNGKIYVFATSGTLRSDTFKNTYARVREGKNIECYPLDGLVEEIERNWTSPYGADYCSYLPNGAPSAVVLGCTHYSFLREEIKNFYRCPVYDSSRVTANRLLAQGLWKPIPKRTNLTTPSDLHTAKADDLKNRGEKTLPQPPDFCLGENPTDFVKISFLGSGKVVNKPISEQMFGLKNG